MCGPLLNELIYPSPNDACAKFGDIGPLVLEKKNVEWTAIDIYKSCWSIDLNFGIV